MSAGWPRDLELQVGKLSVPVAGAGGRGGVGRLRPDDIHRRCRSRPGVRRDHRHAGRHRHLVSVAILLYAGDRRRVFERLIADHGRHANVEVDSSNRNRIRH